MTRAGGVADPPPYRKGGDKLVEAVTDEETAREMARFYLLMQRIISEAPNVPGSEMLVWDPLAGRPE